MIALTKDDKNKENEQVTTRRPSREEEIDYFKKAAGLDIAADSLFAKRHDLVVCLWG